MFSRLTRLLLVAAASATLLPATAAASGAVAVGKASAISRASSVAPTVRQTSLPGGCPAGVSLDAPQPTQEGAMRCLVDAARERYGSPPLTESPLLRQSAIEKGRDVVRCNEFSHTACGREFSFWIREAGYMSSECWRVGENLAWGVDEQGTVGSIFRAWMRSPTHRGNILGDFDETGIELRVTELGGLSGVHLWVQHFGSHCGS